MREIGGGVGGGRGNQKGGRICVRASGRETVLASWKRGGNRGKWGNFDALISSKLRRTGKRTFRERKKR